MGAYFPGKRVGPALAISPPPQPSPSGRGGVCIPSSLDASAAVEVEALVQQANGVRTLGLVDYTGDANLRSGDHVDVDAPVREEAEHAGGVARGVLHPGPDNADGGQARCAGNPAAPSCGATPSTSRTAEGRSVRLTVKLMSVDWSPRCSARWCRR